MHKNIGLILSLLPTIFTSVVKAENNDTQTEELKKLEEERKKLFDDINNAIDESVAALKTANDSDADLGITYIKDLKEQIRLLNTSNFLPNTTYQNIDDNIFFRRKSPDNKKELEDKRRQLNIIMSKKDDAMFNLESIFGKKDGPKYEEKLLNRVAMQEKLDQWILERQREKAEIKKFKALQKQRFFYEDCPRYGVNAKKSRDSDKRKRGNRKSYSGTRPCCRKCCKKSYMGCLRK